MSHKATNWLSGLRDLSPGEFVLLFHLCDCHNPAHGCFPSQSYLKEVTGLSNGSINNHLKSMEGKKVIQRQKRHDGATKQRLSTRYILGFEFSETQEPTPEYGEGANSKLEQKPSPNNGKSHLQNMETKEVILTGKEEHGNASDAKKLNHIELQEVLCEAANIKGNPHTGLIIVAPIFGLIEAGYSLKKDILPVIRSKCASGFSPRSWNYFTEAIRGAGDQRKQIASQTKPQPKETTNSDWEKRLTVFYSDQVWSHAWGPKPGDAGCGVPLELIQKQEDVA